MNVPEAVETTTPLMVAAENRQWEVFALLLNTAAYQKKFGSRADSFQATAAALKQRPLQKELTADRDTALTAFVLELRSAFFGQTHTGYAEGLKTAGDVSNRAGFPDKADSLYRRATEVFIAAGKTNHPEYTEVLVGRGWLATDRAKYRNALPLLQEVLPLLKERFGKQSLEYVNVVKRLALTNTHLNNYHAALALYGEALAILKEAVGDTNRDYASTLNNLAFLHNNMGQYKEALALFQQSAGIYKQIVGENTDAYGGSLIDLAYTYSHLGKYDVSLAMFDEAAVVVKKVLGKEHPWYAQILTGAAFIYKRLGDLDKAMSLHEEALGIRKKTHGEEHADYAESLQYLAGLHFNKGQHDKALAAYRQALGIYEKALGRESIYYAGRLNQMAAVYDGKVQYDTALHLCRQALHIIKKTAGENHPNYPFVLSDLATIYAHLGRHDTSSLLLQQALTINQRILGEAHPSYATNLRSLGISRLSTGNAGEAAPLFIRSNEITLNYLTATFGALSEQEKTTFLNREAPSFNLTSSLLYSPEPPPLLRQQAYANQLALKGMVLESQQKTLRKIRRSGDSTKLRLYEQWQANKTFLGKQALLPKARRVPYFDSLQEATNSLEQKLSRLSAAFRQQTQIQRISAKAVAQTLKRGEVSIEFIRFPFYNKRWTDSTLYAALVLLPNDSTPHFVPLCEERQLHRLLAIPKNTDAAVAVQKIYRDEKHRRPDLLYRLIWKPLEKYLSGVQTIHFAPAGLLHQVCFNALRDDASRSLIGKYALHQVLSTRTILQPSQPVEKPSSASLWGGIRYNLSGEVPALRGEAAATTADTVQQGSVSTFDLSTAHVRDLRKGEFAFLPFSKKEITVLQSHFRLKGISAIVLSDAAATEEKFKALDGKSPQVIHLATHGFFLPVAEANPGQNDLSLAAALSVQQNPMFRSGVVLAGGNHTWKGDAIAKGKEDGILMAYEIAQLDLSNTGLVVLSACNTALGDVKASEGVIGLQRALKLAGVQQMLLSLWSVPDKETVELMTAFYRNWLNGQPTQQALRNAQLKMKEKYPPFYWAAFVLIE